MKKIILMIGRLFSYLYPYSVHKCIVSALEIAYTGWRKGRFMQFGKGSKMGLHIRIHGDSLICIGKYIYIGGSAITAFDGDSKEHRPRIIIGDHCMFGKENHLTASNLIKIGKGVRTGSHVLISDNSHGNPHISEHLKLPPNDRPLYSKGSIEIADNVWIGEKASIMAGVTIGKGSIIGANSVVTHNIPPYSIAAGCPARVINTIE